MRPSSPDTSPYAPDLDEVREWMLKMIKAMRFMELVAAVVSLLGRMRDVNTELTKRVTDLRRKRPRSETLERVERQLVLNFAVMVAASKPKSEGEEAEEGKKRQRRSRRGSHPGRSALPKHLERVPEVNRVPGEQRICPQCGEEMTTVGHSSCEILDVRPAQLFVRQRFDERVACPNDDTIVSAQSPPAIVERGKLGDTLIVESLCAKYLEHQPIERQCLHWLRTGVDVAPQTLGRSVAKAIDLLAPIAQAIHDQTRAPGLLATDATGIPVLDRDAPDGIRQGTVWCWTNARWVTFFYSAQGDSDSVRRFLGKDLARTVQCDGTNITTFLERSGGKRPGCWSHGRRRLVEAARAGDQVALEGLRLITKLFDVERKSRLAGDNARQRLRRRAEHSRSVIDALRAWLDEKRSFTPPRTPLGRGLGYLHRQWARLVLFLTDGNLELTNNRVERELRKLVLGRRNWLFVWEDLGGERAATILTIVGTCVAHGVNPRAYLHLVTRLIVHGWPHGKLRELLPDRLGAAHEEILVDAPASVALPAAALSPRLPPRG